MKIPQISRIKTSGKWKAALAVLSFVAAVVTFIADLGGITEYIGHLRSSPTPTPPFAVATDEEILIIIAEFDGEADVKVGLRLERALQGELEKHPDLTDIRIERYPQLIAAEGGYEAALAVGQEFGATMVIWGWYDQFGFWPNFAVVRPPPAERKFAVQIGGGYEVAVEDPQTFSMYVRNDLPAQMTYLTLFTIAQMYLWDGQSESAFTLLDRAIEQGEAAGEQQGMAQAYAYRGSIYGGQHRDHERARDDYDKAIKLGPETASNYLGRGWAHYNLHDYDQAIADLTRAIELDHDYALAYNDRGLAYDSRGDYEQAIDDYTRAIELDHNPPSWPLNNRGLAYYHLGEYDRAIAEYNQAIELDANYAAAYGNRGLAYGGRGDLEEAIIDFGKAIDLGHDPLNLPYNNRGWAYYNMGDNRQAIADYDRAIQIDPNYAIAYNNRGLAYAELGDYERAIADYDRAIDLSHDPLSWPYNNRGLAYSNLGNLTQAIADLTQAIELDPEYANPYYGRGSAYQAQGEKEKAIADLRRYLELAVDPILRQEAEDRLRELEP